MEIHTMLERRDLVIQSNCAGCLGDAWGYSVADPNPQFSRLTLWALFAILAAIENAF